MDRRAFLNKTTLSLATVGATVAVAPRWLADRFGGAQDCDTPTFEPDDAPVEPSRPGRPGSSSCTALPPTAHSFVAAQTRARALGKPLLVLLVPVQQRWVYGRAYGAWLLHAPAPVAAAFGLVEIACASEAELASLPRRAGPTRSRKRPTGSEKEAPPALALVDYDAAGNASVTVAGKPLTALQTADDVDATIVALSRAFAELLIGDAAETYDPARDGPYTGERLERLAARVRAASGCDSPTLDELSTLSLQEVDRHAAAFLAATCPLDYRQVALKDHVWRVVADAARARLVLGPVTDRPWATSGGCGIAIDGEEPEAVGCGMGHVPEKARRFLHLFTSAERASGSGW